ncbi:MAG: hypothetical protein GW839_13445 [Flavobacteriales bacterium]|nr:hypothetical protein [Flavobacteriia bacterium]NCP06636.1 hypothetical protein [Flavobacteriales bacterium]PIV94834.1 MAG: hypothetical protein COW44_02110 [Flavobacteriaceae bacterium CG17_big_fil_post_rev_8_21_14_2_50_33_15]PIY11509.1 MAG: hypothetical protein COZ17_06560 [Flavobacteriaceae bacterium CG_4_10_14_3_um_filter_33_47]PJB17058.1 MAG: hypothetical protein CO117_13030 [Flavobacteriaceae bacterium CG_4_9_14_3_um_filter_33_16]
MAPSKNQIQSLDKAISLLESQKRIEFIDLKNQFFKTREHFRPLNLLNETIKDFGESPVIKANLFETIISITGGYFSKKLIIGKSNSFIKNLLGYVLQFGVTNFISKKVSSDTDNQSK